jgi:hypothetical protein
MAKKVCAALQKKSVTCNVNGHNWWKIVGMFNSYPDGQRFTIQEVLN